MPDRSAGLFAKQKVPRLANYQNAFASIIYLLRRAATPGSIFPSTSSIEAPPPVEI